MNSEYIYGRIPIQECLTAKRRTPHCLYLQDGAKDLQDLYKLAMAASIPVEKTSRKSREVLSAREGARSIREAVEAVTPGLDATDEEILAMMEEFKVGGA